MTWITFAINIVKLLTALSTWLRERELVQRGKDEANAANLKKALEDLAKANGVVAEFKEKSDEDVDRVIEGRGWYRD